MFSPNIETLMLRLRLSQCKGHWEQMYILISMHTPNHIGSSAIDENGYTQLAVKT